MYIYIYVEKFSNPNDVRVRLACVVARSNSVDSPSAKLWEKESKLPKERGFRIAAHDFESLSLVTPTSLDLYTPFGFTPLWLRLWPYTPTQQFSLLFSSRDFRRRPMYSSSSCSYFSFHASSPFAPRCISLSYVYPPEAKRFGCSREFIEFQKMFAIAQLFSSRWSNNFWSLFFKLKDSY